MVWGGHRLDMGWAGHWSGLAIVWDGLCLDWTDHGLNVGWDGYWLYLAMDIHGLG
jgi:hypothetical protein